MKNVSKTIAIIIHSLVLILCLSVSSVSAQTVIGNDSSNSAVIQEPLEPALLEQVLAPIALYPDALLSQILVASTYPLEVVQAARWRQEHQRLTEAQVLAAIEYKHWDPSVKALTPFTDLIFKLSSDLEWLQFVGDAFLQNEYQVLASVQELRHKAYFEGSLADNNYYNVVINNGQIIIESVHQEVIYVPYYDTRVVYGRWKWKHYQPVYWRHPSHYRLHAGFYWSAKLYIKPTIFFGGFHWGARRLVVNHHFYDRPYSRSKQFRNIGLSKYRKWKHNPVHRRGVVYSRTTNKTFRNNRFDPRTKVIKQVRTTGISNQRRAVNNRNVSNNARNQTINRSAQGGFQQQNRNRFQQFINRNNDKVKAVKQQTSNAKTNYKPKSVAKTQSNKVNNNRSYSTSKKNNNVNNKRYNSNKGNYKSNNRSFNQKTSNSKSRYNVSNRK